MAKTKITLLYERLSRDDEKSNRRPHKKLCKRQKLTV